MVLHIDLRNVSSDDRAKVPENVLERFREALQVCFPPESGYDHVWEAESTIWSISRGSLWGLWVTLRFSTSWLDVSIRPYFPIVNRYSSPFERWQRDYANLKLPVRFVADHVVFPLSLPLVILILPLMVVYRLALLSLMPSARMAYAQLAAVWPGIQASHSGLKNLPQPRSQVTPFLLAAPVAVAITVVCFRFAAADTAGSTILYVAGVIGVVISLVLVIALVLTLLGFEVTR